MQIGTGRFTYEWVENWAQIPETESGRTNGRTHGVVVTDDGQVIVFNQANPAVLRFCPESGLINSWGDRFAGAHGLTLVNENGMEFLWLTDQYSGEVVKTTLGGRTVQCIEKPDLPVYREGKYSPTWVAVYEERFGGNGDIWVTDGYGSNFIHRYDKTGRYIGSIDGQEGQAGPFKCPHGIAFDYRKGEPELLIADRSNKRVQVYDAEGKYKRTFGADFLTSPCGFVTHGNLLMIPELHARVTILDEKDRPICYLGENEQTCKVKGWPNHPIHLIEPGKFNSPHGMAADKQGNLYVVEWIIGGRIIKLQK